MADQTELRMNLVAIKRVDPYAKDIVNSSAHVAFYVFNNGDNEWEKTDIEGALFIYSRFAEPYHSIFINNRLNTNSLVEPIRGQIELQSKPPFLLYRNERSRIRGLWFYNNTECFRIGEVIQKLVTECKDGGGVGEPRPPVNGSGPMPPGIMPTVGVMNGASGDGESNNVDIFTMLTKAQEDFQNNSTGPHIHHPVVMGSVMSGQTVPVQQAPPQPPQQQQQQQQQQAISNQNAPRSVVNFFAAAKQPAVSEVPLCNTLAPVHTLEQIEKQHRATTPQKDATGGKVTPEVNEFKNTLKRIGLPVDAENSNGPQTPSGGSNGPQTPSTGMPELGTSPLATFLSAANLSAAMRAIQHQPIVLKSKLIEISELESRQNVQQQQQQQQQHQQQTPLHELLKKSDPIGGGAGTGVAATVVKPALMPPTMFKPTTSTPTSQQGVLSNLFPGAGTATSPNAPTSGTAKQGNGTSGGQQKAPVAGVGSAVSVPSTGKSKSVTGNKQRGEATSGSTPPKGSTGTVPPNAVTTNATVANILSSGSKANLINNNNNNSSATGVEPLTQNQLIQAVTYLIKHDPDFVRKLHEAYVKSFTEMISN
ncbi:mRNA-decapping enzyme 1B [Anopheles nili]|uniref:mRNA-decapping enzyme 1B n=1 Tax=Anopheles nili TaxID=185578 RepID=UPI00237B832F|nr:mRNA-decapping enzyme 1B [Anopheles nili]